MDDAALLESIRQTFPIIDRWRMILASGVGIERDSDLAEDDLAWKWVPSSSVVAATLGSAREHLHAIRLLIEARELFPSATSSLARSGLIAAALGVWLLRPDDRKERLRRSLSVVRYDYVQHLKFGRYVQREFPAGSVHAWADEQMMRLDGRLDSIDELLAELDGACPINITDVVLPAAVEVIADTSLRPQIIGRWQQMSGSVHGLMWQHFGHDGTSVTDIDDDQIGLVLIGGDVGQLVMDYFSVFHLARAGWDLLASRSGNPSLAMISQRSAAR